MTRKRLALLAAVALGLAALSAGIAIAAGGQDETPLSGTSLDRATAAALAHTGGGTVVETEAGDDGAAYSVEIRLDNGDEVEVNLDENFKVVGEEADDDRGGEDGEDSGDED